MAGCLLHLPEDESITLSGPVSRRLLERGDGDAALLYLALLRHHGTVAPRGLAGELRWERGRIEKAESVLQELNLLASQTPEPPAPPEELRAAYCREDVSESLEKNDEFRNLTAEVERKLGKKLSTPDLSSLLGLYDYLGLPADVIYLLVYHCVEKQCCRLGEGRRPGMKQIEKEGYAWARMGIGSQEEAAAYLKTYAARQEKLPQYMRALQLGDRPPAPSEERYLASWQEQGFPPEAVALAYDRTVLRCHELKWPYLNGILKKWHEAGLHTLKEIQAGDGPKTADKREQTPLAGNMRKYVQDLHRNKG